MQDPSGLALLKFAISISLDCEHPLASHKVLWLEFPDIDEIEDVIVEPGLDLSRLGLNAKLGIDL